MKVRRIFFVCGIMVIAALCIGKMNLSFNRLSRYPYTPYMTEEDQQLVRDKLSDKDIEYLIEVGISPNEYMQYIQEERFSIYHIAEYNELYQYHSYLNATQIVSLVEDARLTLPIWEVSAFLNHYDTETLRYWLKNGDRYNGISILVPDASNVDTVLTNDRTVSIRIPNALVELTTVPVLDDENPILISGVVVNPLKMLCTAIVEDKVSSRTCGGLVINEGYVSYQKQEEVFKEAQKEHLKDALYLEDYPGHSEHQLGLAIDFAVVGIKSGSFDKTPQYEWLVENAHRFGFIQTYSIDFESVTQKAERTDHWRYIGVEKATALFNNHQSIMELIHE